MPSRASHSTDELRRMHRFKSQSKPIAAALGQEMIDFFKQSVAKRQTKLEKLAESWGRLVPQILSEHCALESFTRGTLTVMVDSSSHLYELKQLLLSGLEQQLLIACKSAGLRKITLRPGRWYDGESSSDRKIRFSR
ncbi:MAG: DciA family protein [Tepidisphaeraceae bacterium]